MFGRNKIYSLMGIKNENSYLAYFPKKERFQKIFFLGNDIILSFFKKKIMGDLIVTFLN